MKPDLSAGELKSAAEELGLELSISSAYRTLAEFEKYKTVENSEVRCLRVVSEVLQSCPAREHLSAKQILERVSGEENSPHVSTIYRVLERLSQVGLISVMRKGRQNYYEWRSEDQPHGHLTCIECGETIEFEQESLDDFARKVCDRVGYEFSYMEFLIRSVCSPCRQK
jgi:Fur family ferric uptake transcriptional regulator